MENILGPFVLAGAPTIMQRVLLGKKTEELTWTLFVFGSVPHPELLSLTRRPAEDGLFQVTRRPSRSDPMAPFAALNVCEGAAFPRTGAGPQPGRLWRAGKDAAENLNWGPLSWVTSPTIEPRPPLLSFARRIRLPKSALGVKNCMGPMPGPTLPPAPIRAVRVAGVASGTTCPSHQCAPQPPSGSSPGPRALTCPGLPWL